jgi:hypothetical protein
VSRLAFQNGRRRFFRPGGIAAEKCRKKIVKPIFKITVYSDL